MEQPSQSAEESEMQYFGAIFEKKKTRVISVHFQGKPFSITTIKVYALTTNAEEVKVKLFYEDLQDILELIPKDVLLVICNWNVKVGRQKIPGVKGKFGL